MNITFFKKALALSLALMLLVGCAPQMHSGQTPTVAGDPGAALRKRALGAFAQLPRYFIANQGQWDENIAYYLRGGGRAIAFAADAVTVSLGGAILCARFVGAGAAQPVGVEEMATKVNYLIGSDPAKWRTNIPTYGKVVYHDLYPGMNLHYTGENDALKYTLVVEPGTDVSQFQMAFEGADALRVDETGDLLISLAEGELRDTRPYAYQEIGGRRAEVDVAFVLHDSHTYGFTVRGGYDSRYPLVIDPTLEYGTYLGGGRDDVGRGVVVDDAGNVYLVGTTYSTDFPTANPYLATNQGYGDAVVVKIDVTQSGADSLVYATYLGGGGGDEGQGIGVDGSGNVYVTGCTRSSDFPTTEGAYDRSCGTDGTCNHTGSFYYRDVYVAKLNAAGDGLIYSTYLGGSSSDVIYSGIAVDGTDSAYVAGYTISTDFPTTEGAFDRTCGADGNCNYDALEDTFSEDVFVTKLNAAGSELVYSTYVGGSDSELTLGLDVDETGDAYVGGYTYSTDFPTTTSGYQRTHAGGDKDVFVIRLNSAGSDLTYSTYLGGSHLDYGRDVATDGAGNVYVTGETHSTDFPTQNPYQSTCIWGPFGCSDGFVARIDTTKSNAASLIYSTYLGASRIDVGHGIDVVGNTAHVTGWTTSPGFPTTEGAFDTTCGTDGNCNFVSYSYLDGFVVEIDTAQSGAASLAYASYLGGARDEWAYAIAVDESGGTYVIGDTESADFPTTTGCFDKTCGTDGDCNYDPDETIIPYASDIFFAAFRKQPDLSTSTKRVSPTILEPPSALLTSTLHYTITLSNTGDLIAAARLTDTLPLSLALTAGPTCPGYTCGYNAGHHTITWTGSLTAGVSTAITYTGWLSTVIGVGEPLFIVNTAQVDDGASAPFAISAWVAVNPYLVYLPVTLRDF
jgi:uncharacterized repeat protein (TIGR01451 family)